MKVSNDKCCYWNKRITRGLPMPSYINHIMFSPQCISFLMISCTVLCFFTVKCSFIMNKSNKFYLGGGGEEGCNFALIIRKLFHCSKKKYDNCYSVTVIMHIIAILLSFLATFCTMYIISSHLHKNYA